MSDGVRPIFLFSLPRVGSTLVQRVLGAHPGISTLTEPWILLPLLYADREHGIRAEYWQQTAAQGIQDFQKAIPAGAFDRRVREFATGLYEDATPNGAVYFLDKTPRYHFIVEDVIRLFPDAKHVFLWRNPLAVLASMLETFRNGRFTPYSFRGDLERGPVTLAGAFERHGESAFGVQFEDLVSEDGERHWRALFDYLELEWEPDVLGSFADVRMEGRHGDPTGVDRYTALSKEPLDKWRATLGGPVRQRWCRRWLRGLGADALATMGYDLDELLRDLDDAGTARNPAATDAAWLGVSLARELARERGLRIQDPVARPTGADVSSRLLRSAADRLQPPR